MIDANGELVRSQYTDNPNAGVLKNHRLVLDVTPMPDVDFDSSTHTFIRILPVAKDANKIDYEFLLLTEIPRDTDIVIPEE
jgi:hypothetical protein